MYFYKKNLVMKVHILRSDEFPKEEFNQIMNVLKNGGRSIFYYFYPKTETKYSTNNEVKEWDEFFDICKMWRDKNNISQNDYVFLLTKFHNTKDYFSWTDKDLGDYFIHAPELSKYFYNKENAHYAIAYEIVASILRSLMYDTQEQLLEAAHQKARGCIMDYCDDKEEITIKMRTGDVCYDCVRKIKEREINPTFLGSIFSLLEQIRLGLMFRERNDIIEFQSPLRIELGRNRPKFKLVELNNLEINFDGIQTLLYLLILKNKGIALSKLTDSVEELKYYYKKIKNGNITDKDLNLSVKTWVDPDNSKVIVQNISKMNKKINTLLGNGLSKHYRIEFKQGKYNVSINRNLVEIIE